MSRSCSLMPSRFLILLSFAFAFADIERQYFFDLEICTGMGDRVGTMLSLAALARLEGARVVFWWCDNPSKIFSRVHPHIPRWHGYNYSITEFKMRFVLPTEIILVDSVAESHTKLPRVQWEGVGIPAEHGSNCVYTIAWKTTRLSTNLISGQSFEPAYRAVSRPLAESACNSGGSRDRRYVAVHLRGPDDNTYSPFEGAWDDSNMYCTSDVISRLVTLDVPLIAISNNSTWSQSRLAQRLQVQEQLTPYDGFCLLLGASAIVQHAWSGWSSYSSIPAFASGAPLINTYRSTPHRHELFREQGGLPQELYNCSQQSEFVYAVTAALRNVEL
jgi:hypothetical protein